MKYDFSGYVTKYNVKCGDGVTIQQSAFKKNDGARVPLIWQHFHDSPNNLLGYIDLEDREDGTYGYGSFNSSSAANNAKEAMAHGDIDSMSIFANHLSRVDTPAGSFVKKGNIVEVSLVLLGANPGAKIESVNLSHSDDTDPEDFDEAIIHSGEHIVIEHAEPETSSNEDDEEDGKTIGDIWESMNEEQKDLVYILLGAQAENNQNGSSQTVKQSDVNENEEEGDVTVKRNVFDGSANTKEDTIAHGAPQTKPYISREDFKTITADAMKCGSLKEAFLAHAEGMTPGTDYGIKDIEILFPDAKSVTNEPIFIKRDDSWVAGVLNGTRHAPFTRIKSVLANITEDEARARGYIKGKRKKDEVFKVFKRVTTPTTIYKKQMLDRDDILDIVDFNVVVWMKQEMRMMLNEEIARAILVGDGREVSSQDKINEECIRPIWTDDEVYVENIVVPTAATGNDVITAVVKARKNYKGSGAPVFYTTTDTLVDMLLMTDEIGRRLYNNESELAAALRVSSIVEVPVMENLSRTVESQTRNLIGIMVNLKDYTVGTDKGGEISFFDDFDIRYNEYQYLYETRMSGCLTVPKSAMIIEREGA